MNRKAFFLFCALLCCTFGFAQGSDLQQRVDSDIKSVNRLWNNGEFKDAFEKLRNLEMIISNDSKSSAEQKAGLRYQVSRERMNMYMRLRKSNRIYDQIENMERYAKASGQEDMMNDLLYNKAIYYYSFGKTAQGNEVFAQMADRLTASKDYDKVDAAYQTLINSGRKSGNASMVSQAYDRYIVWKDSVSAIKVADEIGALKKQIAADKASIDEKDSSLSSRRAVIIALAILAAALAAALVFGAIVLLRFIMLTRKQKKTISEANENNALKAKFISNISAQMEPTLRKLDSHIPEVKAIQDFTSHIQLLSDLDTAEGQLELEDVNISTFCDDIMAQIREKTASGVTLKVDAPKMTASLHKGYVSHILLHLLENAAEFTPADGRISLDYKKRGPHAHQFIVTNTGSTIPEEQRANIFKPFREVRDLTTGDGLGLPICRQMAMKMNGDLDIDTDFTKGTRFVLNLHV